MLLLLLPLVRLGDSIMMDGAIGGDDGDDESGVGDDSGDASAMTWMVWMGACCCCVAGSDI